MEKQIDGLKDARDQLTLVLSFFPRVDAKMSTVLAVDTAMLAALTAGVPPVQSISVWSTTVAIITAVFLGLSYFFLYLGAFPNVKGGHSSVVFFKDIAVRNESRYLEEYKQQSVESLRSDILGQVWRNSEILNAKFKYLRLAFACMALAVLPWGSSLALFAMQRANLRVVVTH